MDSSALPTPNVKRLSLIQDSITGLSSTLSKILTNPGGPRLRIVVSQSDAVQRELERIEGEVKYPYSALSISNIHKGHDMGYNSALRRNGLFVQGPNEGGVNYIYQLIPVTLTMSFRYWTTDFNDVLNFSTNWMLAERDAQFMIKNNLIKIKIRVKLSEDLSTTPMEFTDYANIFVIDTTLDIYTYCGDINEVKKIRAFGINVGAITDINSTPATMASSPQTNTNIGLTMENFSINPQGFKK